MRDLLFIHALSSLHAGTGQGVGLIDLPIARERATGIPYLPGSSLKGSLRDTAAARNIAGDAIKLLFGPPTSDADAHAGSLQFADQRLLLLPVRSLKGTFAYVTSPFILQRLVRDATNAGMEGLPAVPELAPATDNVEPCLTTQQSALVLPLASRVVLEELDLTSQESPALGAWADWLGTRLFPNTTADWQYWRGTLKGRICLVRDDILLFLLTTATEVVARIRLEEERKTVATGALWYEESLPAETILVGVVNSLPITVNGHQLSDADVIGHLRTISAQPLQLGGKTTVGRGICRLCLAGNGA